MSDSLWFGKAENFVAQDKKLVFTLTSYILILLIYVNLNTVQSSILGVTVSIVYFMINGMFLGRVFFGKESPFLKLMLGILMLIMLLGFIGWLAVIIYNLNVVVVTFVLFVVTTLSSLLNRRKKNRNAA